MPRPPKDDWGIVEVEVPQEKTQVETENFIRLCNRCNRLMEKAIVDEPFCENCRCPEFRLEFS